MSKFRDLHLLVEVDDGTVYQAALTDRQRSAIKSMIAALPDNLALLEDPLDWLYIERNDKAA